MRLDAYDGNVDRFSDPRNYGFSDGSCTYDCAGCTIPNACNYDDTATQDDGSCEFTSCLEFGCTDTSAITCDGGDYPPEVSWSI